MRRIVIGASALALIGAGPSIACAHADPQACVPEDMARPQAELFATNNTATITDPADGRLRDPLDDFSLQVSAMTVQNLVLPVRSTSVDGVYWSHDNNRMTYERSRAFELACVDRDDLRRIGEQVGRQFGQESVLTFEYLPAGDAGINAVALEVPAVDRIKFHDALIADAAAREALSGGSVTDDGWLILIADVEDIDIARRLVGAAGGRWQDAVIRYGKREFVETAG
ncbi:hypothetical protein [Mycobacteroides immunogenum]|uniref:Secreted protein n=1 Tax=Mycobacteroides immunogenum TaxID=83262 RepID=A0A7V8RYW2_9MYCO|nr:hypothetical protein [Mycobacteroides immunogenum]AMT73215.1 hypothetical protein ABG82_26060 [Mycobacteroides immunogenum]ANO06374.1 hypothetical protein BAB75_26320 [Mycobacteroides immunogenum]KIU37859.1 hypothetical protein TL11_25500 [Mycobacteroides immunogenum]KPG11463.1 hypothetical protein AN909_08100 [Mycobacteroides immunogenum]KPG12049.1 hypothetical protein AN910_13580 [Mycobacteroides immunogenum]